jgi:hypothetical protein
VVQKVSDSWPIRAISKSHTEHARHRAGSHITGAEATGATKGTKQQTKKVPGERLKIRIRRNVAQTSHELDITKELWMPQKGSGYRHSPRRGLDR